MTKTPQEILVYDDGVEVAPGKPDRPHVALRWNGTDVEISGHSPFIGHNPNGPLSNFDAVLEMARQASTIMRNLCRWEVANVVALGLVEGDQLSGAPATNLGYFESIIVPAFADSPHINRLRRIQSHGWFLPDADPTSFGTPFLRESVNGDTVTWTLAYVGTNVGSATFAWDDTEGLADAVTQMHEVDREYVESVAFLSDPERYKADLNSHLRQEGRTAARAAYKPARNRVKPRLTQKAVDSAYSRAAIDYRQKTGSHYPIRLSHATVDLRETRSGMLNDAAMHAGYIITPFASWRPVNISEHEFAQVEDCLVGQIAARIRADGLGILVRVTGEGPSRKYLVTRCFKLLEQHHAALGIGVNATIEQV